MYSDRRDPSSTYREGPGSTLLLTHGTRKTSELGDWSWTGWLVGVNNRNIEICIESTTLLPWRVITPLVCCGHPPPAPPPSSCSPRSSAGSSCLYLQSGEFHLWGHISRRSSPRVRPPLHLAPCLWLQYGTHGRHGNMFKQEKTLTMVLKLNLTKYILAHQGALQLITPVPALLYPWHIPLKYSSFNFSQWNCASSTSGQVIIWGDFSQTLRVRNNIRDVDANIWKHKTV